MLDKVCVFHMITKLSYQLWWNQRPFWPVWLISVSVVCIEQILISFCQSKWSPYFCLIPYWSSELPITLRLKDGVYGEAGNNFSLRQSLFEHQTAPHFYDKIKSPAFLHIYYIQLLKLQIRVPKKIFLLNVG